MIPYIETHIVESCNLKCRGCSHFSGLAPCEMKALAPYTEEVAQLAKITNKQVGTFRIMGGEPLLHPDVVDFCLKTRELLPNSPIILVSNGILLHKIEDSIDALNDADIQLCVSDYGLKINRDLFNRFKHHQFHDKTQLYNISLDLDGAQPPIPMYNHCDIASHKWYFMRDGRIYQCCIMANIHHFNAAFNQNISIDLDDISISIFDHTEAEILDFLSHPHKVCRYCDTFARSRSYAPFAVSKGDISEWTVMTSQ